MDTRLDRYAESRNASQARRHLTRSPWYGRLNAAKADCLGDILTLSLNVAASFGQRPSPRHVR